MLTHGTTTYRSRSIGWPARSVVGSTVKRSLPGPAWTVCCCSTRPAAAYADVDEVRIVGLVEQDWPERVRRSIFYPVSLLAQLGWPNETDRLASARARFQDLLRLAGRRVSVSTFTLEDDAIVAGSTFLQELETSGLSIERATPSASAPLVEFAHEALLADPPRAAADSPQRSVAGATDRSVAWG